MRISDWSSDVCSSDLRDRAVAARRDARLYRRRSGRHLLALDGAADADIPLVGRSRPGLCRENLRRDHRAACRAAVDERLCDLSSQQIRKTQIGEHTSELQSLMRISYAVFFLTKKN